jgi:hypothetical protein
VEAGESGVKEREGQEEKTKVRGGGYASGGGREGGKRKERDRVGRWIK